LLGFFGGSFQQIFWRISCADFLCGFFCADLLGAGIASDAEMPPPLGASCPERQLVRAPMGAHQSRTLPAATAVLRET